VSKQIRFGIGLVVAGAMVSAAWLLLPRASPPPLSPRESTATSDPATEIMYALLQGDSTETAQALAQIRASKDRRLIAPLIELLFVDLVGLVQNISELDLHETLHALSGQSFGPDWAQWIDWYGRTDLSPPPGFTGWKGKLFSRIDPRFADFLRDDAPNRTRVEEIIWGGVRVDGIPALDNPKFIFAKEAAYLRPDEPVFGVFINGDARAYPQRILDWHEMANDVVGGVPITLAY